MTWRKRKHKGCRMKSYGAVPLRDSSLWIYSYIHAVGRAGWPSSATPGQWITTQARRSPPGSGSRQKEMTSVKSQKTKQEQSHRFHTLSLSRRCQQVLSNYFVPSVSYGESSSSTATGGFGSLYSLLRSLTPGGGHQTVINLQIHKHINTNSDDMQSLYRY